MTLESESIVLNRDGGSKMWVLSGYNISSLKPASDINRCVCVCVCGRVCVCGHVLNSHHMGFAGWSGLWRCGAT